MLGPSLFGDARLVVVRAAQDVKAAAFAVLKPYLETPAEGTIVLQHAGGAKGKALLEAARKAKALEIGCAKLTRPDERADFVRAEVRRAGGRIAPDAVAALRRRRRQRPARARRGVSAAGQRLWRGRSTSSSCGPTTPGGPRCPASRSPIWRVVGERRRGARGAALRAGGRGSARGHRRCPRRRRAHHRPGGLGRTGRPVPAGHPSWACRRGRSSGPRARSAAGPSRAVRQALGVVADAQRRREGRGGERRVRPRAGGAEPADGARRALTDRARPPSTDRTGEHEARTPRARASKRGRVRALAGALRHRRLLVGGLVGVDDALAGGLVELAGRGLQRARAPPRGRRSRQPRGSAGPPS